MKTHCYLVLIICISVLTNNNTLGQRPPNMELLFSRLDKYKALPVKTYEADSVITTVLGRLCWEYRLIDMDSAVYYCDEALRIAEGIKYERGIALIYTQTAAVCRQKGEFQKALDFHTKALDIWKSFQKNNPGYYYSVVISDEARTLNNMGIIYDQLGENTKAMDLFYRALKIDESRGNKDGAANKLGGIGNVFLRQKQYDKALDYYFQVLKIDETVVNKVRMAECYSNMGFAYWKKNDRTRAMEYYTKAVDMHKSVGNKKMLSENYGNIGLIYDEEKNYTEAANYYNQSLQLKAETDDKPGSVVILGNLGAMYLDRDMFSESERYFLRAKSISDSIGERDVQMDLYTNLCSLYVKKGQYKEAFTYQQMAAALKDSLFNQSKTEEITRKEMNYGFDKKEALAKADFEKQIAIAEANKKLEIAEADKKRIIAETQKKIAVAEAETKKIEAEADKEKMRSESNKKLAIKEFERKQDVAEADKKISLSNSQLEKEKLIRNSIIGGSASLAFIGFLGFVNFRNKRKREKAELSQQISETEMKALRSQMNPHFIFNALQSIHTFLLSKKSEEAGEYLLKFSKLMRLILENSLHAEVPLNKDIEALELYMKLESLRLHYPFIYQLDINKEIQTENITIPPLILQPFIENAIWHGLQYKPEHGLLNIKIEKLDDYIICRVQDNGMGRAFARQIQSESSDNNKSLGLKITAERLAVINKINNTNASFELTDLFDSDNKPSGTLVTLKLPCNGID